MDEHDATECSTCQEMTDKAVKIALARERHESALTRLLLAKAEHLDAEKRYERATLDLASLTAKEDPAPGYEAAYRENDLRNKISQALAEVEHLALVPNAWISEAYRQALKTYADLRAELIRMNPGAI